MLRTRTMGQWWKDELTDSAFMFYLCKKRPGNSHDQSHTSRAKLGSCLTLREGTSEGGDRTLMTDDATAHQDMSSNRFLMVPPGGPGLSCQGSEHSGPVASTDFTLFP